MAEYKKETKSNKPIKSWFITFPQSREYTLQVMLEYISTFPVQYAKLVMESHQDGSPHMHIVVQYKTPHTKNAVLAIFKTKLPNDWKRIHIQSLGSKAMADIYLNKEAIDTLEYGTYVGKVKKEKKPPVWLTPFMGEEKLEQPSEETRVPERNAKQQLENRLNWLELRARVKYAEFVRMYPLMYDSLYKFLPSEPYKVKKTK